MMMNTTSRIMKTNNYLLVTYGAIIAIICWSSTTSTTTSTTNLVVDAFAFHGATTTTRTTSLFSASRPTTNTNFPFSTRAALIEKAKQINTNDNDDTATTTVTTGTYSARGWSNRLGSVLTPVAIPGVYTADRPFYWNNIDVGCRMTIIELSEGGGLWIHSPVNIDKPLITTIRDKLKQEVKYVVSPNYEHVKYAKEWYEQYPTANMWGCPGLCERIPEIKWAGEIPYNYVPGQSIESSSIWDYQNEIIPYHIDMELNPFTNKPFFNEVIYYHVPSKTLLTTDLYWNYPTNDGRTNSFLLKRQGDEKQQQNDEQNEELVLDWELAPSVESIPLGSKLWKFGMDQIYKPFYKNLMIQDKKKYETMCNTILNEWDIETVIPAHGDILHGKDIIRSILTKHLL